MLNGNSGTEKTKIKNSAECFDSRLDINVRKVVNQNIGQEKNIHTDVTEEKQ